MIKPARNSLKQFQKTRNAIRQNEPLFDMTNAELSSLGFQTPIRFNITESILAGLPGLLLMLVLFLVVQPILMSGSAMEMSSGQILRNMLLTCGLLSVWVFIPPIYAGSVAPFAGSGSIRVEDRTPALKSRATRAYLFYDGAYGLTTHALIGMAYILLVWVSINASLAPLAVLALVGLFAASIHQLYLSFSRIPKLMFTNNGYSVRVRRFWQKKQANDPPWNRYQLHFIGGGFLTGIALGFLLTGFETIVTLALGG